MKFIKTLITISLLASICCSNSSGADLSGKRIFLLSENRGIMVSSNNGESWHDLNNGLPGKFIPEKIKSDQKGNLYLITLRSGIFSLRNDSSRWSSINTKEFLSGGRYSGHGEYRKISAFTINYNNPDIIALSTKHSLYISYNSGRRWKELSLKGLHKRNYITSIAMSGEKPVIYAGTSFKGIFRWNGKKFISISRGLPVERFSVKTHFYEEVTEIYFDPVKSVIYSGFAFGRGIYYFEKNRWKQLNHTVFSKDGYFIHSMISGGSRLFATLDDGIISYDLRSGMWEKLQRERLLKKLPVKYLPLALYVNYKSGAVPLFYRLRSYSIAKSHSRAVKKRAIYSSAHSAGRKLNYLIRTIKKTGLNSIVVDMKDDFGYLYFPTNNVTAREIRSSRRPIKVKNILKKFKEHGIYVIARVVVFKDRALFRGYGNRYAIWNRRTGRPWRGTPNEYWVDPHSEFVMKYNVDIARELEELGFDEIQFDYIRFPTDGATHLCKYRYRERKDIYKSEVLSDFLKLAKKNLSIPVSVDIYGFNAWYKSGNWMGQDIESFSYIVDVICPMDYPSHFGNRFYMKGPRHLRPYRIIFDAGLRAKRLSGNRSIIRPYLQAFKLLSPTWGPGYIVNQVKGAVNSKTSGYTFWNARSNYKMVIRAMGKEPLQLKNQHQAR